MNDATELADAIEGNKFGYTIAYNNQGLIVTALRQYAVLEWLWGQAPYDAVNECPHAIPLSGELVCADCLRDYRDIIADLRDRLAAAETARQQAEETRVKVTLALAVSMQEQQVDFKPAYDALANRFDDQSAQLEQARAALDAAKVLLAYEDANTHAIGYPDAMGFAPLRLWDALRAALAEPS